MSAPAETMSYVGCVRLTCARHVGWIGWELHSASVLLPIMVNLGFPTRAGLVIAAFVQSMASR